MSEVFLPKQEIAKRYQISVRQVTNLMRRRILPFVKVGRMVRFNTQSCDKALMQFEVKSVSIA